MWIIIFKALHAGVANRHGKTGEGEKITERRQSHQRYGNMNQYYGVAFVSVFFRYSARSRNVLVALQDSSLLVSAPQSKQTFGANTI